MGSDGPDAMGENMDLDQRNRTTRWTIKLTVAACLMLTAFQPSIAQERQTFLLADPVTEPPGTYDPIESLEAKINSLQSQVDSMQQIDIGQACDRCDETGRGGFYVGAAAVFAKPHLKEAFQHSRTNRATGRQALVPFEYDYEATPRINLGYRTAQGFGVRATFWDFDADGETRSNVSDGNTVYGAHAITVIFPANIFAFGPGQVLQSSDSLEARIINYYATYDASIGGFDISGGVGLRNVRLRQSLNSVVRDPNGAQIRRLTWERNYEGLGPAVTVDASRRIGNSPFSVFTQAGGSFLFGTKSIDRTVVGDLSPQPASPILQLEDADEVVGVGELGLGVEWSRQLASGHNLSVRGSYEGSLWAEGGAPTLGFLGFEGFGVQVEVKR